MQTCHGGICSQGCSALAPCQAGQACVASVCRPAAAGLHFSSTAVTAVAGDCSPPLTVELTDANGARTAAADTTVLALSGSLAGTAFFVDSACTVAASALAFEPGDEVVTFYFRAAQYGSLDVTATTTSLGVATQTEAVSAQPKALKVTSAPQVLSAGQCSAVIDVEVDDAAGMPSAASQPRVIDLKSDSASLSWFSDAACTSAVGQVVLAPGSSAVHLYARDTHAGVSMLAASSAGLDSGTQPLTLNPGMPSRIGFDTPPRDIEAGACSLAVTVRSVDDFGNPSGLAAPAEVTPFAPSAAQITFFTDRVCTTEIAPGKFTLTLPAGDHTATLYLRALQAGATVLGVSAQGVSAGSQTQTVYPSAPVDVTFSTPRQTIGAGQCSSAFTVVPEDKFRNYRDWTQSDTLTFNADAPLTLYTDAMCMQALGANGTLGVSAGSTGVTVWAKSTSPGFPNVYVSSSLLSTNTYQQVEISDIAPDRLVFVETSPAVKAGGCSDIFGVDREDRFTNPTSPMTPTQVTLGGPGGVQFFAPNDSSCVSPITGITITSGTSRAFYRVRAPSAGNVMLTASSMGLTTGTVTLRSFALPDRFSFTTQPQTITAGACSMPLTLRSETSTGTPLVPGIDAHIYVGGYALGTWVDNVCGVGLPNTEVLITADGGTPSGTYYVTYPFTPNVTLNASANFYAPGTGQYLGTVTGAQTENVSAAAATQLRYTSASGGSVAGDCSGEWDVEVRDTFGNPVPQATPRTLNVSVLESGVTFFAGPTCSGPSVTSVIVPAMGTKAVFSMRGTTAGSKTIQAQSAPLTAAVQGYQVSPAAVTGIAFTTTARTLKAGMCANDMTVITVSSVDQFGNASPVGGALNVYLTTLQGAANYYSDLACSAPSGSMANPATIATGASATQFYALPSMSGTLRIQASAANYTMVTQDETVN
jgi:hypothetical protein